MKLKIKQGEKRGKLTLLHEVERIKLPSGQYNRAIKVKCDCGNEKIIRLLHWTRNRIKSCGCIVKKRNGKSTTLIGNVFRSMTTRTAPYHSERHLYYDRGIKVCDEWLNDFDKFEQWCLNNGFKKGLQIDRIDNEKGYSPDNCRFVTAKQNANNQRTNVRYFYNGEKLTVSQLIDKYNIDKTYDLVRSRLKRGWSVEDALYKPTRKGNYKNN